MKIPEQTRAEVIRRFEAASAHYERAKPKSLSRLISTLNKTGLLYDSIGGEANKRKAAERYERSLSILKADPELSGAEDFVTFRLVRLYYETGRPALAEPFVSKTLEDARARGGEEEEAEMLWAIARYLKDHPAASEFTEKARQFYHRKADTNGEAKVLYYVGSGIKDVESQKARHGKPLSEANYKRALAYYESALALTPVKSADFKDLVQLDVWKEIAHLQEVSGHMPEAIKAYERVSALGKGVSSDISMSDLYKKLGKLQMDANLLPGALQTYKDYLALLDATHETLEEGEREGVVEMIRTISLKLGIQPPPPATPTPAPSPAPSP